MSELNDRIKALVAQYPGSKSELARLARIDRSTLYKILNGQRLPTETQLQDLLTVLPVSQGPAYRRPAAPVPADPAADRQRLRHSEDHQGG